MLNGLEDLEFFNIGMKNLLSSNSDESYRIISGSKAHKSVKKSDGQLYGRGHFFAKATEDGDGTTIGLSTASKVWSNKYASISDFVNWCQNLSKRIASTVNPRTGTEMDFLKMPLEVDQLPNAVAIAVTWNEKVFRNLPNVIDKDSGEVYDLLDVDLEIDFEANVDGVIQFNVIVGEVVLSYSFSLNSNRYFNPIGGENENILIGSEKNPVSLTEFINLNPLNFYLQDFSLIQLNNLFPPPDRAVVVFDLAQLEVIDWSASNVNIKSEFGQQRDNRISIHQYINDIYLPALNPDYAFYDHGKGEVADFVVFKIVEDSIRVQFFHIKGTKGNRPGERVNDVYEVTGQAVRSVRWLNLDTLHNQLTERYQSNNGGPFRKDDPAHIETILAANRTKRIEFEIVLVQPGISKAGVTANIASNLSAAYDFCSSQFSRLRILTSA